MKYFGSTLRFTRQRNDDIITAYRRIVKQAGLVDHPLVFAEIARSPASRFWVSEERAAVVVARMLAGISDPRMRGNKKRMFDEIFRRFLALSEKQPDRSLTSLVCEVVHQPAPEFYLTPRTVGEIVYRIKNGWYERRSRMYRQHYKGECPPR